MAKSYNVLDVENNEELIYRLKNEEEETEEPEANPAPTGLTYKNNVLTVAKNYSGTSVDASDFEDAAYDGYEDAEVKAITATANTTGLNIIGSSNTITITGGSGVDTISDASVMVGGKGDDIFLYEGGAVEITDYANGDIVRLGEGISSNVSAALSSNNKSVVFTFGEGNTLTVPTGKTLTFQDKDGKAITAINRMYAATVNLAAGGTYDFTSDTAATAIKADSKLTAAVEVTGNTAVTYTAIDGAGGNDTITAGKVTKVTGGAGNDVITITDGQVVGGAGDDTLVFNGGAINFNDYAYNGKTTGTDAIKLAAGWSYKSAEYTSNAKNVIFTFEGTDDATGTVTVPSSQRVTVYDADGKLIDNASRVYGANVTLTAADVADFKLDDQAKTVVVDDSRTTAVSITGNTAANTVTLGKNSADVYTYVSGKDIINGYAAGDVIQIDSDVTSITTTTAKDGKSTIVFAFDAKKTNTLTIKDVAAATQIKFVDSEGKQIDELTRPYGTSIAIDQNNYSNHSNNNEPIETIDAGLDANLATISAADDTRTRAAYYIVGNSKANSLVGSSGTDTLNGVAGKNTLTGGDSEDVFMFSGGTDIITDYTPRIDKIYLNENQEILSVANGTKANSLDVVFTIQTTTPATSEGGKAKVSKGTLTLTGKKDSLVTFIGNGETTSLYSQRYGSDSVIVDATTGNATLDTSVNTLAKGITVQNTTETFYAARVIGNANANTITGGKGNDYLSGAAGIDYIVGGLAGKNTIEGGAGNDILYGSYASAIGIDTESTARVKPVVVTTEGDSAQETTFIYTSGDGNDSIGSYKFGTDKIVLGSSNTSVASVLADKNNNAVVTVTDLAGKNKGTITIANGKDKEISIVGSSADGDAIDYTSYATLTSDYLVVNGDSRVDGTAIEVTETAITKINAEQYTTSGLEITSGKKNVTMVGTSKDDAFVSGGGADIILGGDGNDSIMYTKGNKLTIVDYNSALNTETGLYEADADQSDKIIIGNNTELVSSAINAKTKVVTLTFETTETTETNGKSKITKTKGTVAINPYTGEDDNGSSTLISPTVTIFQEDENGTPKEYIVQQFGGSVISAEGDEDYSGNTAVKVINVHSSNAASIMANSGNNTINAASTNANLTLNGGAGNDSILGGAAATTFIGGLGNDTFTSTGNKNDFYYSETVAAGTDVITNYGESGNSDVIRLGEGVSITGSAMAVGATKGTKDAVSLTVGKTKVNVYGVGGAPAASLGTEGTADDERKEITVVYGDGDTSAASTKWGKQIYGLSAKATLTIDEQDGNYIDVNGNANVLTVDASDATQSAEIIGNAKANTIIGGTGTQTYTLGKGNDVFYFSKKKNGTAANPNITITDYSASGALGADKIWLDSDVYVSNAAVNDSDVTLTLSDASTVVGTLKLENAANKKITMINWGQLTNAKGELQWTDKNKTIPKMGITQTTVQEYGGNTLSIQKTDASPVVAPGNVTLVDASTSGRSKALVATSKAAADTSVTMLGGTGADYLTGGAGSDCINGGTGNDTLDGGGDTNAIDTLTGGRNGTNDTRTANTFRFSSNGSAIITDYTAGKDQIKFVGDVTVDAVSTVAGDGDATNLVFTFVDHDAVYNAAGSVAQESTYYHYVTLKGAGEDKITVTDGNGFSYSQRFGSDLDSISIAEGDGTLFDESQKANKNIVTVDGSARTKTAFKAIGNTKNNVIIGGTKNDTLNAGTSGSSTLTGGNGNDVFIYNGGSVYISDYVGGKVAGKGDVIQLTDEYSLITDEDDNVVSGTGYSISADDPNDIVFSVKNSAGQNAGTITVHNGKDSLIAFTEYGTTTTIEGASKIYTNPVEKMLSTANKDVTPYGETSTTIEIINASNFKAANISVAADNTAQKVSQIIGSKAADTLHTAGTYGTKGRDDEVVTLTGGNGNDYFIYEGGNVVITDYNQFTQVKNQKVNGVTTAVTSYVANQADVLALSNSYSITAAAVVAGSGTDPVSGVAASDVVLTLSDGTNTGHVTLQGAFSTATDSKISVATAADTAANIKKTTSAQRYGAETLSIGKNDGTTINTAGNTTASVIALDTATRKTAAYIIGNAKANAITGGAGADTLNAGTGGGTLTGGAGNDIFLVDGAANIVISDYHSLKGDIDNIRLVGRTLKSAAYDASTGVTLTLDNNNTVRIANGTTGDSGKLGIYDASGNLSWQAYGGTSVSIGANDGNTIDASANTNVTTIDASSRSKAVVIIGNTNNDTITVGKGADTIYSGAGNDSIISGTGKNVFVIEAGGGNDVIENFSAANDTLKFSEAPYTASVSGSDVIFTTQKTVNGMSVPDGTVTLKNVVYDSKGEFQTLTVMNQDDAIIKQKYYPTGYMDITNTSHGASARAEAATTVMDAHNRTTALTMVATSSVHSILGGKGADSIDASAAVGEIAEGTGLGTVTIAAGAGNDTITANASSTVTTTVVFSKAGGNDVITNYSAANIKVVTDDTNSYKSHAIDKSGNLAVTFASGGTITFSGVGYDTPVSIDGTSYKVDSPSTSSRVAGFAEELDDELFNSTNFATGADDGLDSIMNVGSSNSYSTEELYNTSVDATSLSKITASVVNKKSNNQ